MMGRLPSAGGEERADWDCGFVGTAFLGVVLLAGSAFSVWRLRSEGASERESGWSDSFVTVAQPVNRASVLTAHASLAIARLIRNVIRIFRDSPHSGGAAIPLSGNAEPEFPTATGRL